MEKPLLTSPKEEELMTAYLKELTNKKKMKKENQKHTIDGNNKSHN
jgi:hypothetical protein